MNQHSKHLNVPSPWFETKEKESLENEENGDLPNKQEVEEIRNRCEVLYKEQLMLFDAYQRKFKKSDAYFADSVVKTGTLSDKMASQAIQIRDSPFFSLPGLRQLVGSAEKKGRREAELAAQHLSDLFCGGSVMPKDRLLVSLAKRPKLDFDDRSKKRKIMLWYFEDQLKIIYGRFVQSLDTGSRDELVFHKDQCLKLAFRLLMDIPEREKETLAIVINKAGDKVKRISSRVPYLLGMLLQKHSNMRQAVVAEVERFLYRPSVTESAQYYLTIFLTQVALVRGDKELAKNLIQIYFSFLQKLLEAKDDNEGKKNKNKKRKFKKQSGSSKYKKKDVPRVPTKILHMKVKSKKLNSKMLTALLTGVSRAFPYLDKEDVGMFDSQMDVFYRVIFKASFNKACHALSLLLKIMTAQGNVTDRYYETLYQVMINPELRNSSKQALFLNVVYGAIRHDKSIARVRAFLKRLLQVTLQMEKSSFACAALVVVSEALRLHEDARDMILVYEKVYDNPIEDGEAVQNESKIIDTELEEERKQQLKQLEKLGLEEEEEVHVHINHNYNPLSSKPLRCNAENSCAWELTLLAEHNHPTVSLFAKQLLNLSWIEYQGDPLLDFSLPSFLDRWAYKKPKIKGERTPAEHEARYQKRGNSFAKAAPSVDSNEFATQREEDVREEEQFMYKYMTQRNKIRKDVRERQAGLSDSSDDDKDDLADLIDEEDMFDEEEGSLMDSNEDIGFEGEDDDNEEDDEDLLEDDEDEDEDLLEEDYEDEDDDLQGIWEEGGLTNILDGGGVEVEREEREEREEEERLLGKGSKKRHRQTHRPKKR